MGLFMKMLRNKRVSRVQNEMGGLMLSVWEGWRWDDNKGGWLDPELCTRAKRDEVEHIRRHKVDTRVSRETCLRETGRAPIKTGWAETDKGQPGHPNVRASWVSKEYKTHARPELHASTLEALKVVLSEIATGKRGGKVVALVDVRRAYFCAPARRRVFVELPLEDDQPGDEHMCGLYGTGDAAQHWEEEIASTLSDLEQTRRKRMPVFVERPNHWGGRRGNCAWRRHHNQWRTVGGGTPSSKIISRKKSGRILNRVIEWDRDGITTEARQRHVREVLKDLELERGNQCATPCALERRDERGARNDESKAENQWIWGQSIGTMRMTVATGTDRR